MWQWLTECGSDFKRWGNDLKGCDNTWSGKQWFEECGNVVMALMGMTITERIRQWKSNKKYSFKFFLKDSIIIYYNQSDI